MKKSKNKRNWFTMEATTTSKDWGFIPVSGKGGKTTNCDPTLSVNEAFKACHGKKGGAA